MRNPFRQISPARIGLALRLLGVLVLLMGLGSAALIWRADDRAAEQLTNPAAPLAASDSRKQSREIEIYYGKTGVLMERWREELGDLTHGKPLAKLIAVFTLIAACGCFYLAERWPLAGADSGRR